MTEKLFELRLCSNGSYYLWNNNELTDIDFDKFNKESAMTIVDLLNGLAGENEQLKQSHTKLKHRHSLLHDECLDAECDRDSYRKDVLSLEKENEELKKENNILKASNGEYEDALARLEEENEQLKQDKSRLINYLKRGSSLFEDEDYLNELILDNQLLDGDVRFVYD